MKCYKILVAFALLVMILMQAGCAAENPVTNLVVDPNAGIEQLTLVVTAEEIGVLEEYPDLKEVDLTGSTCYKEIETYIAAHPEVSVTYKVMFANQELEPDTSSLILEADSFQYNDLLDVLKHLPKVNDIVFPCTNLSLEELDGITVKYPNIQVGYTLEFLGKEVDPYTTDLNLSELTAEDMDAAIEMFDMVPNLERVELSGEVGTSLLSMEDALRLMEAAPEVQFHYSFDFYGNLLSTDTERVELENVEIGNEGEQNIRNALSLMPKCTYFKLEDCGIDSEVMASIRDDYPDVKVVWRIYCGKFTMCTDETMVRMTFRLDNTNCHELMYCTDVTYMDIGHNEELTDVSFVKYMPNLECVIVSGSPLTDISAFADHDKLTWMELCFCGQLADISALESCDNIKYLNISFTKVSDLSPIENLPLERLNCMGTKVSVADTKAYEEKHPDCLSRFTGQQPYGYGWRYNDHGYTFFEYYANMRVVFRYDDTGYSGNRRE